MVAQIYLLVVFIYKHQLRLMLGHLIFMDLGKSRNDHKVAHRGFESRGAVDRNHAGTAFAFDGVGHQAFAVVDVPNVNLLVFANIGGFQ